MRTCCVATELACTRKRARWATEDMCSPQGFALCVAMVMSLKGNGLLWLATVCSTWVFMCRGTSQRSKIDPLGRTELPCVRSANLMVSRCALLMRLCHAKGGTWILEQPMSSLMIYHPRLQEILRESETFVTNFNMGAYNAPSKKPTKLYSNRTWPGDLRKKLPANSKFAKLDIARAKTNASGKRTVSGGKHLKATQTYPRDFGKAVSKQFAKHRGPDKAPWAVKVPRGTRVRTCKQFVRLSAEDDPWDDADLKSVYAFLGIRP